MKFSELEVGVKVTDRWFPYWGIGKVITVLKTVAYIEYSNGITIKYDRGHVQFLSRGIYK